MTSMKRLVVCSLSILLFPLLPACGSRHHHPRGGLPTTRPDATTPVGPTAAPAAVPAPPAGAKYTTTIATPQGDKLGIDAEIASMPRFEKDTENGSAGTAAVAYVMLGSANATFTNLLPDRPAELNRFLDPRVQVVGYWPPAACVGGEDLVWVGDQQLCGRAIGDTDFDYAPVAAGESRTYQMPENEYRNGASPVAEEGAVDQALVTLGSPPLYVAVQGQQADLLHRCGTKEAIPAPLGIWDYKTGKPVGCQ